MSRRFDQRICFRLSFRECAKPLSRLRRQFPRNFESIRLWSLVTPCFIGALFAIQSFAQAPSTISAPGDTNASSGENETPEPVNGSRVYASRCAACHQASGNGLPGVFPPLRNDETVVASDPADFVRTVLYGQSGKAIDGFAYALTMPAFAEKLTDEEIAAVATYVRIEWGDSAPAVGADYVSSLRE